jgi:DNA polymerase-3 subunit gamma/tau
VLSLVHKLLAEGQNLQHFCREAIGHFRNLLVARVCGADSELIAAPADERPRLKKSSEFFSEEDLTRFFQILLHTDDDLRHKPDARLHLEMGLLRMVNAARLAPLEELLGQLEGGTPASPTPTRSSSASAAALPTASASAPAHAPFAARVSAPPQAPPAVRANVPSAFGTATPQGAATATAPARVQAATVLPPESAAPTPAAAAREDANPVPMRVDAAPTSATMPDVSEDIPVGTIARAATAGDGLVESQVDSIKHAIAEQGKFLGELVGNASRWEMSGGEVRLFFPVESRALADLLQTRETLERLRNVASRILGHTVRVCVKLETVPAGGTASNGTRELRAKFEQDPIVRAMLERFGGQISDVKRRGEE